GNYRPVLGYSLCSIGIGTYLGNEDDATDALYAGAVRAALIGGINLVDTAVNYRCQRSERVVGRVVAELAGSGEIKRDQVVIATKGGYIPFDGEMPDDPRRWLDENFLQPGIMEPNDLVQGMHCMTPRYLGAMPDPSRANPGLETIDTHYFNNPATPRGAGP